MIFAGAMRADIADYLVDTYELDARQHGALTLLLMRYRLAGPLPFDDKRLADIARVSRRVWSIRVWPALRGFFTPGDDGMIHHEEMDRTLAATDSKRSAAGRAAATARWDSARKTRQGDLLNGAAGDASTHAFTDAAPHADASESHMRSHTNNAPFSTDKAFTSDSGGAASASPDASGASLRSRAPSLSASLSSLPSSSETPLPSEGESARGRPAPDASSHASGDASGHASGMRRASASHATASVSAPLPADWQPSPDGEREARKWGYVAADLADGFRDWYVAKGELRADWDAAFRTWCRRQAERDGKRRQGHLMVPIQGGKDGVGAGAPAGAPDEADEPAAAVGDAPEAQWQRVRRTIKREVGATHFRSWFAAITLLSIVGEEVTLGLPRRFLADWVRKNHGDRLEALWQAENPHVRRVAFVVAADVPRAATG